MLILLIYTSVLPVTYHSCSHFLSSYNPFLFPVLVSYPRSPYPVPRSLSLYFFMFLSSWRYPHPCPSTMIWIMLAHHQYFILNLDNRKPTGFARRCITTNNNYTEAFARNSNLQHNSVGKLDMLSESRFIMFQYLPNSYMRTCDASLNI